MARDCEDDGTWLIVRTLVLGNLEDKSHDEAAIADPAQRVEMTSADRDSAVLNALYVLGDIDIYRDALKVRGKLEPTDSLESNIHSRADLGSSITPQKKLAHPDTVGPQVEDTFVYSLGRSGPASADDPRTPRLAPLAPPPAKDEQGDQPSH
jgi:hypothetical protein